MTRKMKDSGIEWIGEIPEEWKTCRVKNILIQGKEGMRIGPFGSSLRSEYIFEDEEYKVYGQENLINDDFSIGKNYISLEKFNELSNYELKPGDITFSMMGTIGKCSVIPEDIQKGIMNSHLIRLRINLEKISNNYFKRYFNYNSFTEKQFDILSKGTIMNGLNSAIIKSIVMILPPVEEQNKIDQYLDKECTKIDETIEKQKQIIEKLKEYKQSIITEAVTKGLNPDVPMKDSGIEWIGKIPEHWKVTKIGNIFNFIGGFAFSSEEYCDETDNQIIRIGNVKNDSLILNNNPAYVGDDYTLKATSSKVQEEDILFTMTGTKGKRDYFYTLLIKHDDLLNKKLFLNQRVGCFRKKVNMYPNYYNYLLKNERILDSIFIYETGTANQGNLGIETIRKTRVHLPPLKEQKEISDFLDDKCLRIDAAITKKESLIEKLTEYKKSLIYECVTGKKELNIV